MHPPTIEILVAVLFFSLLSALVGVYIFIVPVRQQPSRSIRRRRAWTAWIGMAWYLAGAYGIFVRPGAAVVAIFFLTWLIGYWATRIAIDRMLGSGGK